MKEINDIIRAFHLANEANIKTALATVVRVEGSSYRQPGARMLVTETGQLTGAISGGCLEGDALRKALLAIEQQQKKLITYDTSSDDDLEFGVQLGCNGIVHILFEPINYDLANNPIRLLEQLAAEREKAVIVTFFSTDRTIAQPGTSFLYRNEITIGNGLHFDSVAEYVSNAMESETSVSEQCIIDEKPIEALIEFIPPPVRLVIAGAGNDTKPLVEMASALGWETFVVDGRKTHATKNRFPLASEVLVIKSSQITTSIPPDNFTVFALMTHNYHYDLDALRSLLETEPIYIGILGPKKKFERMLTELEALGISLTEKQLQCIHTPIGLDIGAETSEEIAVSIVAEIKAVLSGRKGSSLKHRSAQIHTQ